VTQRSAAKYSRVLLKLSGEALLGDRKFGISPQYVKYLAEEIRKVQELPTEVAIVIGGGNFMRGAAVAEHGIDRVTADYMGMLAMVINALALQSALEQIDVPTRVQSAKTIQDVAEPYIRRRAIRHLEKGRVVIFAAGTGNPYFTSDTAATLRAAEIFADVILMGKNQVDGVYDADPRTTKDAKKIAELTHRDLLDKRLGVMDATAAALAEDRDIPIIIFDISQKDAMVRAAKGEHVGTLVHSYWHSKIFSRRPRRASRRRSRRSRATSPPCAPAGPRLRWWSSSRSRHTASRPR
jgi:uridylate kinase